MKKTQKIRSKEANYRWWSSQKISSKCRWIEESKYWTETTHGVQAHPHWTKISKFQSTRYLQACISHVFRHDIIIIIQLINHTKFSRRKSIIKIEQFWLYAHLTNVCIYLNYQNFHLNHDVHINNSQDVHSFTFVSFYLSEYSHYYNSNHALLYVIAYRKSAV